jgi:hypothetical protein
MFWELDELELDEPTAEQQEVCRSWRGENRMAFTGAVCRVYVLPTILQPYARGPSHAPLPR